MIRRVLLCTAAILVLPGAAVAQDQPGSVDWSGYYAGVLGGTADFEAERRSPKGGTESFSGNGRLQGLVAGFNVQRNQWVYGIEADIASLDWTQDDLESSRSPGQGLDATAAASLRGRFGFAHGQTLVFATAGIGHVDRQYTGHRGKGAPPVTDLSGTGPVAGVGIEHRVGKNLSLGLEGLVFFEDKTFGEVSDRSCSSGYCSALNAGNVGIIRARLTYSW